VVDDAHLACISRDKTRRAPGAHNPNNLSHYLDVKTHVSVSRDIDDLIGFVMSSRERSRRSHESSHASRRNDERIDARTVTKMPPTAVHVVGQFVGKVDRKLPHIVGNCPA
jgi:hypothetical protein